MKAVCGWNGIFNDWLFTLAVHCASTIMTVFFFQLSPWHKAFQLTICDARTDAWELCIYVVDELMRKKREKVQKKQKIFDETFCEEGNSRRERCQKKIVSNFRLRFP